MSINISTGGSNDPTIVNVGDEITSGQLAALQNAQGASATNPCLTRTNSFTTADAAVRITQSGTGESLRIEDEENPDSTPFIITNTGKVAIGTTSFVGSEKLRVVGDVYVTGMVTDTVTTSSDNTFTVASGAGVPITINNGGTGNSFVVNDVNGTDSTPFIIDADGRVTIGATTGSRLLNIINTGTSTSSLYIDQSNSSSSQAVAQILNSGNGPTLIITHAGSATSTALTINNNSRGTSLFVSSSDSFNANEAVVVNYNGTGNAVRITNTGTGNSFVVEDDTNPDATPFVINNEGRVGVRGSINANYALNVNAGSGVGGLKTDGFVLIDGTSASSARLTVTQAGNGGSAVFTNEGTGDAVRITNTGTGNSFIVEDSANPDASPFVINADGNIGIGRSPTSRKVEMSGSLAVTGVCLFENNTGGTSNSFEFSNSSTSNSGIAFLIENRGSGNSFVVRDEASDTTPFIIAANGDVTLGGSLTLAAGAYSANTAQASVTPDYPHELTFIVGGVTYRVPARAI